MRKSMRRAGAVAVLAVGSLVLSTGAASAHECTNASKNANNPAAGAQLVLGADDEVIYISKGLQNRIDQGLVDFDSGEGFHGLIAFDIDGDGVADASTWIVGPDDEIPLNAQENGSPCHGVVNIGYYFENCLAA